MIINGFYFKDRYNAPGVCIDCGSRWPAMTTLEAFNNRQRASVKHPGKDCSINPSKTETK